jgi:hypothetical protein
MEDQENGKNGFGHEEGKVEKLRLGEITEMD